MNQKSAKKVKGRFNLFKFRRNFGKKISKMCFNVGPKIFSSSIYFVLKTTQRVSLKGTWFGDFGDSVEQENIFKLTQPSQQTPC